VPLDCSVTFKTVLRKNSKLLVPRAIRMQFKLESTQVLEITITLALILRDKEIFFGKMRKDGYITVPPLTVAILKGDMTPLENQAIEVTL